MSTTKTAMSTSALISCTSLRASLPDETHKAPNKFALGQTREVLFLLRLCSKLVDGAHDQTALHTHDAPESRIDTLDFARDQAVRNAVDAGTAVAFDRRAEEAEGTERGEDGRVPGCKEMSH